MKYYKGLGTSTAAEGKAYFSDLDKHRIDFEWDNPDEDDLIEMVFAKVYSC
jgi:DNA topoisomerase-2